MQSPIPDHYANTPKGSAAPAVYRREGQLLIPGVPALSGWSRALQNGSAVAGLLAHEASRRCASLTEEGWMLARHSVDLFRPVRFEPGSVDVRLRRDGQRLRLIDAALTIDGVQVAGSTTLFLRGPQAKAAVGAAPALRPFDDCLDGPLVPWRRKRANAPTPFEAYCECRWATDYESDHPGVWLVPPSRLVADEPTTVPSRVVATADLMAALAAVHRVRADGRPSTPFVNADLHVFLGRVPRGDRFALRLESRSGAGGVELAEARLYDDIGPLGLITQTRLAQPRRG